MIKKFSEFILESANELLLESKVFVDDRKTTEEQFYAAFYKEYLFLGPSTDDKKPGGLQVKVFKDHGIDDYYNAKYLIINPKRKIITNLNSEFISLFDENRRRKRMKYSESLNPSEVSKFIKELIKRGIVDSSYKYISDSVDFKKKIALKGDYINAINSPNEDIVMYHGTTMSRANQIVKFGLRPQDTEELEKKGGSMYRKNSSYIEGYTDKNVYLTPSIGIAKQYAYRQSKNMKPAEEPAILKITIPDSAKIVLDDDVIKGAGNLVYTELKTKLTEISEEDLKDSRIAEQLDEMRKWADEAEKNDEELSSYYFKRELTDTYSGKASKIKMFKNKVIINPYYYSVSFFRYNLMRILNGDPLKMRFPLYVESMGPMDLGESYMQCKYFEECAPEIIEILVSAIPRIYKETITQHWKKGAYGYYDAIAYRGIILPKFIEIIPVEYKLKKY